MIGCRKKFSLRGFFGGFFGCGDASTATMWNSQSKNPRNYGGARGNAGPKGKAFHTAKQAKEAKQAKMMANWFE